MAPKEIKNSNYYVAKLHSELLHLYPQLQQVEQLTFEQYRDIVFPLIRDCDRHAAAGIYNADEKSASSINDRVFDSLSEKEGTATFKQVIKHMSTAFILDASLTSNVCSSNSVLLRLREFSSQISPDLSSTYSKVKSYVIIISKMLDVVHSVSHLFYSKWYKDNALEQVQLLSNQIQVMQAIVDILQEYDDNLAFEYEEFYFDWLLESIALIKKSVELVSDYILNCATCIIQGKDTKGMMVAKIMSNVLSIKSSPIIEAVACLSPLVEVFIDYQFSQIRQILRTVVLEAQASFISQLDSFQGGKRIKAWLKIQGTTKAKNFKTDFASFNLMAKVNSEVPKFSTYLGDQIRAFQTTINTLVEKITELITRVSQSVGSKISFKLDELQKSYKTVNDIIQIIRTASQQVGTFVASIIETTLARLIPIFQSVGTLLGKLTDLVKSVATTVIQCAAAVVDRVVDGLDTVWQYTVRPVVKTVSTICSTIVTSVKSWFSFW